jgi:hypothetical protein
MFGHSGTIPRIPAQTESRARWMGYNEIHAIIVQHFKVFERIALAMVYARWLPVIVKLIVGN